MNYISLLKKTPTFICMSPSQQKIPPVSSVTAVSGTAFRFKRISYTEIKLYVEYIGKIRPNFLLLNPYYVDEEMQKPETKPKQFVQIRCFYKFKYPEEIYQKCNSAALADNTQKNGLCTKMFVMRTSMPVKRIWPLQH